MADMVATSTDAEDETPLPSGTAEETWKIMYRHQMIKMYFS